MKRFDRHETVKIVPLISNFHLIGSNQEFSFKLNCLRVIANISKGSSSRFKVERDENFL